MSNGSANESPVSFFKGFDNFAARSAKERAFRVENGREALSFGISFLDECLGGIFRNDLVLLGAKTGFGKSQLASLIAMSNVKQGKRVHFLALEAEEFEIERRIKYQFIADRFFKLLHRPPIRLNYMDWYYGRFDQDLDFLEEEVQDDLKSLSNLNVYYRHSDFDVKEFERIALGVKNETDLIIVDHLHYFDYDDQNENRAVKQIVKTIRDCALISGKPVILIAHVRKIDKRLKQLVPDIEDFHGSSDIGKIATKAITIAPCYGEEGLQLGTNLRKTFFQVLKCRVDGARTNMTGLMVFNSAHHNYQKNYYVGKITGDGSKFEKFSGDDVPFWATNAIRGN